MRSPTASGAPALSALTPSPRATTLPVISWPRIWGKGRPSALRSISPRHWCRSEPQTFARVIRITTAPGSGSGTGYSFSSKGRPAFSNVRKMRWRQS